MPMLLEDLAEETSASNRRAADRLDAEARNLAEQRPAPAVQDEFLIRAVESARQATAYAISRLPEAEGLWRSDLAALRKAQTVEIAVQLLRTLLGVFESGQRLIRSASALWVIAQQAGATPERLDELDRTEDQFKELAAQAKQALDHRADGWQVSDPARLEKGLQLAREGQAVTADEARAWFRGTPS